MRSSESRLGGRIINEISPTPHPRQQQKRPGKSPAFFLLPVAYSSEADSASSSPTSRDSPRSVVKMSVIGLEARAV